MSSSSSGSTVHSADSNTPGASVSGGTTGEVYNCYSLISGLPLHIDCITGYDDYVIVGSREGHLLIYRLRFRNIQKLIADVEITLSNKNFTTSIGSNASRKPIIQIDVIPEHKILVVLTSEGVSTHDMSLYNCKCIGLVERTKGASSFALHIQRHTSLTGEHSLTVRICVVVGRSLQFYYWKSRQFMQLQDDFHIPEIPKTLAWHQEVLILGLKSEYCLIHFLTTKISEVCGKSKYGEPIITLISENEYAVANEKQTFMFQVVNGENCAANLEMNGESTEKGFALLWSDNLVGAVFDEPYFIGILQEGITEVRTIRPKLKVDSFKNTNVKLITRSKPGLILLASSNSVWCLCSTPIVAQIDMFVKQHHFELALQLGNIWNEIASEKRSKLYEIKSLHGFHLFCKKNFKEAMTIFMELGTDASHVIGLFPGLLPTEFRNQIEYPGVVPELRGADLESAMSNLIMFLTSSRTVLQGSQGSGVPDCVSIIQGGQTIKSKKQLLQIIDTTLLKCYLKCKESLIAPLLRLKDNHCHPEETEKALIKHKKHNELIILYQSQSNHRKALTTLLNLQDYDRIISYLQTLGRQEMDLILEFSAPVLKAKGVDGLKIFTEPSTDADQLSRPRVYDFISRNFLDLKVPYLEHVVQQLEECSSMFHNALVNEYCDAVVNTTEEHQRKPLIAKLGNFLLSSKYYTPEVVICNFPYDCLLEERALVLERMGRHDEALGIFLIVLKDTDKALEYCKMSYNKEDPVKSEIFLRLIRLLLNGPVPGSLPGFNIDYAEEHKPDIKSVVKLLKEYSPYLDPLKVLSCLPDNIKIADAEKFVKSCLQNRLSEKRRVLIEKGLVKAEFYRATMEKVSAESCRFRITENSLCAYCKKRMASQNAFVLNPDKSVVHFYCQPVSQDRSSTNT